MLSALIHQTPLKLPDRYLPTPLKLPIRYLPTLLQGALNVLLQPPADLDDAHMFRLSAWSPEEVELFEQGCEAHGKNFAQVHKVVCALGACNDL